MILVRAQHLNELAYCHRGARAFFAAHGLDWKAFLREGLPAETFEATGDAMAIRLARHVRDTHGQE